MPTYSLTLRELKGSKLTIQEMDNNWLYLQDLASQGGGTVDIDQNQIAIGDPSGLTSSSQFQFDILNNNLILGASHSITGTSSYSTILGGVCNSITGTSSYSTILGGCQNYIYGSFTAGANTITVCNGVIVSIV